MLAWSRSFRLTLWTRISASLRSVMLSCETTTRATPSTSNRVIRTQYQRRSVGEWQGYSSAKVGFRPASTSRMPSATFLASSEHAPAARSHARR